MFVKLMMLPLFALGAGETLDTIVDTITVTSLLSEAGTFAKTGMSIVWTLIVSNPVLELSVAVSLIFMALAVFKRVKRVARR